MNAIIVDDEKYIRDLIKSLLTENFKDINITASVSSVKEAYEAINNEMPDLLFLDVELPDGNGFELLGKIPSAGFKVIFITGHSEYAVAAIKVSALDYILKPIDTDELCRAVEKARDVFNHEEEKLKLQALFENLQGKKTLKRIILHTSEHLQLVSVSDIIRAEADSNYTRFWLAGGRHIMVSRPLKEFDALLSGSGMLRVHQSHLVNINYIDKIVKKEGGRLLLKDNTMVPVSSNLKKQVLQSLADNIYE
jgi:two-component system LytT family response regulator